MVTRREFIRTAALFALVPPVFAEREKEIWVNDVHSQLNRTRVRELLEPRTRDELAEIVRSASRKGFPISVSGCRHSMGGQQFATDSICINTRELDHVISFDRERGLLEAEAGIQWPKLIRAYLDAQAGETKQWGIAQKQTGADTFTLGGSLSSNVHGRGLRMKPLISNIESFTLITADGKSIRCSREENSELFRLAIGGYGLFGLIDTVTLRLVPRQKLRRVVEMIRADDLPKRFEERIKQKFLYGDFQCAATSTCSAATRRINPSRLLGRSQTLPANPAAPRFSWTDNRGGARRSVWICPRVRTNWSRIWTGGLTNSKGLMSSRNETTQRILCSQMAASRSLARPAVRL